MPDRRTAPQRKDMGNNASAPEEIGSRSDDGSSRELSSSCRELSSDAGSSKLAAMGSSASAPAPEEEIGSRSGDGSSLELSSEGSSLKRATTSGEAAGDLWSGSPPKRARDDVSRCCELEGGSREEGSSGSTKVDVPSSYPDQGRTGRGHEELPAKERSIVEDAMKTDLGLDEPREFQVRAGHEGSFKDGSVMHVWAKTGSGKSAIPLTISTLRRGISLVMVPLLGLGSDLREKSHGAGTNIESYHVDEHHGEDATMLKRRLSSYDEEEAEDVSIILFISPQALGSKSHWFEFFKGLAKENLISLLCIDEAHAIEQQGRHFLM